MRPSTRLQQYFYIVLPRFFVRSTILTILNEYGFTVRAVPLITLAIATLWQPFIVMCGYYICLTEHAQCLEPISKLREAQNLI